LDNSILIDKIATSKDGKILGNIIRIEGREKSVVLANKPRVVIKVDRLLNQPDFVEIILDRLISFNEKRAIFDITKEEFIEIQKAYRVNRKRALKESQDRTRQKEAYDKTTVTALKDRFY